MKPSTATAAVAWATWGCDAPPYSTIAAAVWSELIRSRNGVFGSLVNYTLVVVSIRQPSALRDSVGGELAVPINA